MDNQKITKKTWAITTFFNPEHYNLKLKNYKKFSANLKKQGVPLLVVECVFFDDKFELNESDADKLVQVKSNSILWQKERLLNIALNHLPVECENIVWVDADIIFLNDNWLYETEQLLEKYPVVQPFATSFKLGRWEKITDALGNLTTDGRVRDGFSFYYNKMNQAKNINYETDGGFAWAGKKKILEECGFYDLAIVGSADWIMVGAFIGLKENVVWALDWMHKIQKHVSGNIYFTTGSIIHLYHGLLKNRSYDKRGAILDKNNYDPKRDLVLNNYGCWEWSKNSPESLRREVALYFRFRNEDDKKFVGISKEYILEMIGQFGIFIRSIAPSVYHFLKKIK